MKLCIDIADMAQIRHIYEYFPVDGVSTNPSILAKEGRNPYDVLKEIRSVIGEEGELFVQATAQKAEVMAEESRRIIAELGKTTLVKLLCGFYRPDRGRILINGIPASDFAREEYFELISVLFQDSALLPMTLDFNLTGKGAEAIDRKRLTWALKVSGFWEKYQSLPQKGQSLLVREVSGSVDFSGGEKQKLLFARALYKEAPLMILDEPTAALDPIAENEMYLKFDEAARGRTCLYISHRLSSTRFCDRILLMEQGQVMEEGTHEELMARGGRYRELFEMQSRYYREREEQRRRNAFME